MTFIMRFQTRLLVTYSLLVVLLIVGLGAGFLVYSTRVFEDNARTTYSLLADRMAVQFSERIRAMDFFETNLASDLRLKAALDSLGSLDHDDPRNGLELSEAAATARVSVVTYSAIKSFSAVLLYNTRGDFFSSNFMEHTRPVSVARVLTHLPWISEVDRLSGKALLTAPHDDPWATTHPQQVFSLVRHMPGSKGDLGYIEVQDAAARLDKIFTVPDRKLARVIAWTADGSLFYQNQSLRPGELAVYQNPPAASRLGFTWLSATGRSELVVQRTDPDTGVLFSVALDRTVLTEPLTMTMSLVWAIGLALILVSFLYNWYSSRQLAQPLRLIQKRIESTGLSDLPEVQTLDHPNDEVVALSEAFEHLKKRLDQAIEVEIHSRTLTMQSQLDSLQAQVNPHFLYNVLNIVAAKGREVGSIEVGTMCSAIAGMLRYSTGTDYRVATLADEVRHVKLYLGLMKQRFETRLSYTIDIDPELLNQTLPKIVVQQLVENSINHGYEQVSRPMDLEIRGRVHQSHWSLEVLDNGQGFLPEVLEAQRGLLAEMSQKIQDQSWTEGLGFGGLGLRNTFGRLILAVGPTVTICLENRREGGALVRLDLPFTCPGGLQ